MNDIVLSPAEQNELKILELIKYVKVNFLTIGNLLLENYDKAYWSLNGHESFKSYIEMLGVGSYSWVTRLIDIARIVSHNILTENEVLEIGVGKVSLMLPSLKDGGVDTDIIELAKSCPYHDLRLKLGGITDDNDMSDEWLLCPRCGERINFKKEMLRR